MVFFSDDPITNLQAAADPLFTPLGGAAGPLSPAMHHRAGRHPPAAPELALLGLSEQCVREEDAVLVGFGPMPCGSALLRAALFRERRQDSSDRLRQLQVGAAPRRDKFGGPERHVRVIHPCPGSSRSSQLPLWVKPGQAGAARAKRGKREALFAAPVLWLLPSHAPGQVAPAQL